MVGHVPPAIVRPFVPVLREGDAVPSFALRDQRGRPFSFAATGGRTTIVSFIYTRCRDVDMCPLVAAKFARMQRESRGTPIRLVTVTLDPAYDTPAVLARYGAAYGADASTWSLVGGTTSAVDELVARFGVGVERRGAGVIMHTEAAVVVDARGRVARFIDGATWLPDDVLGAAREVATIPDSPLHRMRLWLASSASALCGGRGATPLSVGTGLALLVAIGAVLTAAFTRMFARRSHRSENISS
ncbi:MAG: electron transport protein SCO1/SenC [Candidatus Eremiobacteraeota bacterium]|nr:electron transport protein SCO1/SenC [Candidatus Eremiobacteraeota bacterium]